jgi:DNA-directed RNA polymerase subunit RPC12/RpoP
MALVPCRECGKEVSDQAESCPYCGIKTPSAKRHKIKLSIRAVILVVVISIISILGLKSYHFYQNTFGPPPASVDTQGKPTPAPKIQKDVPVKQQIIQKDYKEKIKEMLDSGQSVHEISKKTGIRVDEVRKIKKENK